jgi:hypothetical protein
VPERVAVTGFRGARRYVNRVRPHHRYFTLYEVADLATFENAEYLDLVRNPTQWSETMRPDFRNFVRAACRVTASRGEGIGAAIAVLCHERAHAPGAVDAIGALLDLPGVTACHVGEGSAGAPAAWSHAPADPAPTRAFDRIVLVEALDREGAAAALVHAQQLLGLASLAPDLGCDVYDLAFAFPGHDPGARVGHRRSNWRSE